MVSIIVPAYNCEKYIDKCIDSLIRQTYGDIEIIVIDDGSRDSTWQKLQSWAHCDRRIIALHFDNAGVVTTRRRGLEAATGEWLTFVDSDDYLPDDAIASLMEACHMINGGADLVVGAYSLQWAESGIIVPVRHDKHFSSPNQCAAYCLKYGETFLPIKLYRTAIYREAVDIPSDICVQEDTIGILQYLSRCSAVASTNKSIYFYLKHNDSASYSLSPRHITSLLKVAVWLSEQYSDCEDKALLTEIERTCIKNLYAYIKNTDYHARDHTAVAHVLDFIKSHPAKVTHNYQLRTVKVAQTRPKAAKLMISVNDTYLKTIKTIKQCVRKVLK